MSVPSEAATLRVTRILAPFTSGLGLWVVGSLLTLLHLIFVALVGNVGFQWWRSPGGNRAAMFQFVTLVTLSLSGAIFNGLAGGLGLATLRRIKRLSPAHRMRAVQTLFSLLTQCVLYVFFAMWGIRAMSGHPDTMAARCLFIAWLTFFIAMAALTAINYGRGARTV